MPRSVRPAKGFSLIEGLVALIILSVGLLGVSKMVTNSLQFADSALMRTQSVVMAYDLADKIRANEDNSADYAIALGADVEDPPDCAANVCTAEQLAAADLADWKANLSNRLPVGDGGAVVTPTSATITVRWNDRGTVRNFAVAIAI